MKILTIDVGGGNVKFFLKGMKQSEKIPTDEIESPKHMCKEIMKAVPDFTHVSIGFPAVCKNNRIVDEPKNLSAGWKDFDFESQFKKPTILVNDAVLQAVGSYEKEGKMLFLCLGTGLGTAIINQKYILPMEGGHLPFKNEKSFENYVGAKALKRYGKKKWTKNVLQTIEIFKNIMLPDYIVVGGGNVDEMETIPKDIIQGNNALAFKGGEYLWTKKWIL